MSPEDVLQLVKMLGLPENQVLLLQSFLNEDNLKDIFDELNMGVVFVTQVLKCVELDKFEGFDSEYELEKASMEKTKNSSLWGGR